MQYKMLMHVLMLFTFLLGKLNSNFNLVGQTLFRSRGRLFFKILGDYPYYAPSSYKETWSKAIEFYYDKPLLPLSECKDRTCSSVVDDVRKKGISKFEDLRFSSRDLAEVENYFEKIPFYDSHIPMEGKLRDAGVIPSQAYKSYNLAQQLNCEQIVKLCLNPQINQIARGYLGNSAEIYGLNTFATTPGGDAFTHGFHRDVDDIRFLVFFLFWTPVTADNGAFQQILYTHRDTTELAGILKSRDFKGFSRSPFKFAKQTIGYSKDEELLSLFKPAEIETFVGRRGTVCVADTFGIHRGLPVTSKRLVTWVRFGVSGLRASAQQGRVVGDDRNLTLIKTRALIDASPNAYVLDTLLHS